MEWRAHTISREIAGGPDRGALPRMGRDLRTRVGSLVAAVQLVDSS
jgi:hypothetical protein